jgi:hypothetical protein
MPRLTRKSACPPKVLARLALTRRRQKAWRERPDHMEGIRQRATAKARTKKQQDTELLKGYIAELPSQMTRSEVLSLIATDYCKARKVSEQAFWQQVRNHRLLTYDGVSGLWVNHLKETKA